MAANDLMTFDEPRARLTELDYARSVAERELEALRNRRERIVGLATDRHTLLDSLVGVVPDALDSLTPEEHHHVYKLLRLRVTVNSDGTLEVTGAFGDSSALCHSKTP